MAFRLNLKSPLIPLSLVVLIDHIGLGIIFPILVPIFMDNNGILGPEASSSLKSLWYNLTLSVFPIALFFGSTLLGSLSDRFGRKKVLAICLMGATFSYVLSGIALDIGNIPLLILSRALAGFTAGSMPIAQAAVIDISTAEKRAGNLGLLILAGSLGFLLGPLVGGIFSNTSLVNWFSYSTPLYFAGLLAFLNFCSLKFVTETFSPNKAVPFQFSQILDLMVTPFKEKQIRFLAIIYLFLMLGWGAYFQFVAVFLLKKHQYSSQGIGLYMSLMGVGFAVGSSVAIRLLVKYFQDVTVALLAAAAVTLNIVLTVLELHSAFTWIGSVFVGCVYGNGLFNYDKAFFGYRFSR